MKLFNTLSRKKEEFKSIDEGKVRMYCCGPTVYSPAHIGNLRAFLFSDTLRRVFEYAGYEVLHGMNITDVGHLVGDGDEGEDKLEVGARKEKMDPLSIARKYEKAFIEDLKKLGVELPQKIVRATESIEEQQRIIKILEEKGFTYIGEKAVYFDTSRWADYGKLAGQNLKEKKVGVREEIVVDEDKKNPQDFALWFFLKGRYANHILHWPSPWGEGFPGWHIECSAISREILGQPFDIHCGAEDLIGTHHPNEMAQSEAAFGVPLSNYWMHNYFLIADGQKMSKSLGNVYTLSDLIERGFEPEDFRYLLLGARYNATFNFTIKALEAARTTVRKIRALRHLPSTINHEKRLEYIKKVEEYLYDDLDTPKALAVLHEANDFTLWQKFDRVFVLNVDKKATEEIPKEVVDLSKQRERARGNKDWPLADELRERISELGYTVEDKPEGTKIYRSF